MSGEVREVKRLVQRVRAAAKEQRLWQRGDTIVAACSGGPDSLALLHILLQLREAEGLRLVVAHFEHGIRGEASLADAAFVQEFARSHGVDFFCGQANVPQWAREKGLSVETAARECRYRYLWRIAAEQGNALLATAHHADDQAETVLMRLLRGTGIAGLAAMRPRQGRLIRPLLGCKKAELEAYCQEAGLEPRRDETNFQPLYLRNRLRLELLPQLQEQYNPRLVEALTQLAMVAAETDDHLTAEARDWVAQFVTRQPGKLFFSRQAFQGISAALQMAVLAYLLEALPLQDGPGFTERRALRKLLCDGTTGARLNLPAGWQLELSYDRACLQQVQNLPGERQSRQQAWPLQVPGVTEVPELGLRVTAELGKEYPQELSTTKIVVDAEVLQPPYQLRLRQPGDSFALAQGRKKLKDYFIDSKLPRQQRERVPVFTAHGEIFWLGGLRQPHVAWVQPQTKKYLSFHIEYVDIKQEE